MAKQEMKIETAQKTKAKVKIPVYVGIATLTGLVGCLIAAAVKFFQAK